MVHDHKIYADLERYMGLSVDRFPTQMSKPHSIPKKSHERPNSDGNGSTNYPRRIQQSDCL